MVMIIAIALMEIQIHLGKSKKHDIVFNQACYKSQNGRFSHILFLHELPALDQCLQYNEFRL